MGAVIAWTCKLCGHHVAGMDVDEYIALDNAHVCKAADVIRRAVPYLRRRSPAMNRVADWLDACARQADGMTDPLDFSNCDEPSSVQHALAVARTIPWEQA